MQVSNSPLLKISMAVDSDDMFVARVKAACALTNVEYTRQVALQVAAHVTDQIDILDGPAISTVRVEDVNLLDALKTIRPEIDTSELKDLFEAAAPVEKLTEQGTIEP